MTCCKHHKHYKPLVNKKVLGKATDSKKYVGETRYNAKKYYFDCVKEGKDLQ